MGMGKGKERNGLNPGSVDFGPVDPMAKARPLRLLNFDFMRMSFEYFKSLGHPVRNALGERSGEKAKVRRLQSFIPTWPPAKKYSTQTPEVTNITKSA